MPPCIQRIRGGAVQVTVSLEDKVRFLLFNTQSVATPAASKKVASAALFQHLPALK